MPNHGVAITVPEPWATTLQQAREDFGDPMASAIPPHVTLLPPTAVGDDAMPAFLAHLQVVTSAAEPFEMVLSGTGTFRPVSPVVFVQVSQGIPYCEALERAVRSGPIERTLDFPYHPHVTVAHHLDEAVARPGVRVAGGLPLRLPGVLGRALPPRPRRGLAGRRPLPARRLTRGEHPRLLGRRARGRRRHPALAAQPGGPAQVPPRPHRQRTLAAADHHRPARAAHRRAGRRRHRGGARLGGASAAAGARRRAGARRAVAPRLDGRDRAGRRRHRAP